MFFKKKAIPIDARPALGFRGKINDRSCFYCGTNEENNFDRQGKLHQLEVKSIDRNYHNTSISNHIFKCKRCGGR